jgi:glycosyltransferase involved in cell wall biosynthesis
MTKPLVSILTPSFNQARWLEQNIESVQAQSYGRIEHIVVDGGSSDGTTSVLRRAPANVRWVSEPDRGQSHALNKAFAMSRGDIIGWINSDDAYFSRHAVSAAVETLERDRKLGAVYGHAALINAEDLFLQILWAPSYDYERLLRDNFLVQPTVFMRRELLTEKFIDESYDWTMDRELWLRVGKATLMKRIDSIVAVDRHYPGRKSEAGRLELARDNRRLQSDYGFANGVRARAAVKGRKIVGRVRAIPLAIGCASTPTAFPVRFDPLWTRVHRQMAVRRRSMPSPA